MKLDFWNDFCRRYRVLEDSVPLFDQVDGHVATFMYRRQLVLRRSAAMEELVITQVTHVLDDFARGTHEYEGVIYIMFWPEGNQVTPLYIGKSEKYGRSGGNLSANIENISRNLDKFARWGYTGYYHFGGLSKHVLPQDIELSKRDSYGRWADRLFETWPTTEPRLRRETRFWMMAWPRGATGAWVEFGPTSLTFLEYQLIGVASDVFSQILLNAEGVNRT